MIAVHLLPARDAHGSISLSYRLVSGRSAATFALLAGISLALATDASRGRRQRGWADLAAPVLVRSLAIGVLGLALGYPGSGVEVILPYYAILFVLAIPLLRLEPRVLATLAISVAVVVPIASHLVRQQLGYVQPTNPTFGTLAHHPLGLLVELTLTGFYPVLAWMTYLCAGLAVGRLSLESPRVATRLLVGGVVLASLAALCSFVLLGPLHGRDHLAATLPSGSNPAAIELLLSESRSGTTPTTSWWWLSVDSPHSSTPEDLLETTGIALALVGAMLLAARHAKRLLLALAAAGSMTLTLYTGHVLTLASPVRPVGPTGLFAIQVLGVIGFALAWRWLIGPRGPLEHVVATLSNLARPGNAGEPGSAARPAAGEPAPGGGEGPLVERAHLVDDPVDGEPGQEPLVGSVGTGGGAGRVGQGGQDRRGQPLRVARGDQAGGVAVGDGVVEGRQVAGHHRRLHGHGLDQDVAEPFPARRDHHQVGGTEQVGDVLAGPEERRGAVEAEPGGVGP
jgi:hypothetical protein